jgi:hypothetical protein
MQVSETELRDAFDGVHRGETVEIGILQVWEDFIYQRRKDANGNPELKRVLALVYFDEDEDDSPSQDEWDGSFESFRNILGSHGCDVNDEDDE